MINLKTKHEIELMARAGTLLNSVITEMKAACEPGVTTGDLDPVSTPVAIGDPFAKTGRDGDGVAWGADRDTERGWIRGLGARRPAHRSSPA